MLSWNARCSDGIACAEKGSRRAKNNCMPEFLGLYIVNIAKHFLDDSAFNLLYFSFNLKEFFPASFIFYDPINLTSFPVLWILIWILVISNISRVVFNLVVLWVSTKHCSCSKYSIRFFSKIKLWSIRP